MTDDDVLEGHERALQWERFKRSLVEDVLLHGAKHLSKRLLVDRRKAAGKLCANGVWRQQKQEFIIHRTK